jgi:hypothetical protein
MDNKYLKWIVISWLVCIFIGAVAGYNFKKNPIQNNPISKTPSHSETSKTYSVPQSPESFETKTKIKYITKKDTEFVYVDSNLSSNTFTSSRFTNACDNARIVKSEIDTTINKDTFNIKTYFKGLICSDAFTIFNWKKAPKERVEITIKDSIPYPVYIKPTFSIGFGIGWGLTATKINGSWNVVDGPQLHFDIQLSIFSF